VLNGSQRNKDEQVKFSWNDIFYRFLFLSDQFIALIAGKKNKFISFHERSPDNHTQFQTKKISKTIPFGVAHTYIPDIEEYPRSPR